MHRRSSRNAEQEPTATRNNERSRHIPRATFIVTTPGDRGKHNRNHISAINANSALLRHSRARVQHVKLAEVIDRTRTTKPRIERSLTADSGYQSDHSVLPEDKQQVESRCDRSNSKTALCSCTVRDGSIQVENGKHNDSGGRFSSIASYQHSLDKSLQSTLDPFLRLPIDLSLHERGLLHFYLTDARTLVFGKSPRPVYDVAVHCANLMVEHCSLYTVVKLASAESILCRATGKDLSPTFYSLRARAYNMMNRMLNTTETSFFDKVEGFHQLGTMEMYLNHTAEQKQHLQAMWQYIEARGGCSRFLSNDRPSQGTLGIGVYSGNFVYIDIPMASSIDLDRVVSQFVSSLEKASMWHRSRWSRSQYNQSTSGTQTHPLKLPNLRVYFDWLINECLKNKESPKFLATGAFHSVYNFFMIPVIFDYDSRDSTTFLRQVENCMQQRAAIYQEPRDVPELVPTSHILQGINCMLSYVRSLLSSERQEAEVELCERSVDALKIFPLLSRSSVLRLVRDMIRCLLMPASGHSHGRGHSIDSFDEICLQDLTWEAGETWKSRFGGD